MKLSKLASEIEKAIDRYDLSDDYLKSHGHSQRMIGEFQYGISSVPCEWVYPYLKTLVDDERLSELVREIEEAWED